METTDLGTKPTADNTNGALLRKRAAQLFWQGYTVSEIAKQLRKNYSTVDSWKRRDGWREAPVHARVGSTIDRRLCLLIDKEQKDRKSTRLNSSHDQISYAVFCLKKKKQEHKEDIHKAVFTSPRDIKDANLLTRT